MDSIPSSYQNFRPSVVKPGSTFESLTIEDIDALISEQQAKIFEPEPSIQATLMHHDPLVANRHRAIARYRSCRNERTALINRLPEEVFSEILLQYSFISRRYHGYYSWLKAAHVCRYWRNVLRSMPQLFSYIRLPVISPTHLDEFIRASGQLPLHITIDTRNINPYNEVLEKLLPRTQNLQFDAPPTLVRHMKWPVCPVISSLVWTHHRIGFVPISFSLRSRRRDESRLHGMASTWTKDISRIMPNLQLLKMSTDVLGADWLRYPLPLSLTTLTLHHNSTTRPRGSMASLIRTLMRLTSLEIIELSGLKIIDYGSEPNVDMGGEIAHLKLLSLSNASRPISAFLRHVRAVDNVDLTMKADAELKELWSLPSMLRTKLSPVPSTSCPVPSIKLRLVIINSALTDLELTVWVSSERSDQVSSIPPKARIKLERIQASLADTLKLLEAFSDDLSVYFTSATHLILALRGRRDGPIDAMQNVLRQLWNITHLTMELPRSDRPEEYKQRDATFLISFSSVLAPSDSENQESAVLPNMRTLQINVNGSDKKVFQTFYVNTLGALRRRRDGYGLGLRTLKLIVPSTFIPFIETYSQYWQDVVDEQIVEITEQEGRL